MGDKFIGKILLKMFYYSDIIEDIIEVIATTGAAVNTIMHLMAPGICIFLFFGFNFFFLFGFLFL